MDEGFTYEISSPGDVISTGPCEGVGPMDTGDTVEAEISHIGVLRNPVIREAE